MGSKLRWFKTSDGSHRDRALWLLSQHKRNSCLTGLLRKYTLVVHVLAENVFLMSRGSSSSAASTPLDVQGQVLCYCDGSAWYPNDSINYYWVSVCFITSPWPSPWFWRWANVVHPKDMFARMKCMSMVTEYLAMGLALRIVGFYRFPIGVVVYDSDNVLDLLKQGNFRCDRNQDRKVMWEEWLLLQAVLRQLDICLCCNLQIRFRHKKILPAVDIAYTWQIEFI